MWLMTGCAAAVVAAAPGCGPSVQSIHEGNVRFEHCYRLDMDQSIAPTHRLTCWQQWTKTYAYGQPRDKIEYARRRTRFLAAGNSGPSRLDLSEKTKGGATTESPAGAPAPTSAHAPPPPTAAKHDPAASTPAASDGGADVGPPADLPTPPFAECFDTCRDTWRTCQSPCSPPEATPDASCPDCKSDYRACLQRCLK